MKRFLVILFLVALGGISYSQATVNIANYTIDSSTSRTYAPLSIPRFHLAALSGAGDLAIYMSGGFPTTSSNFYVTKNLDTGTWDNRWVEKWAGVSYPLDHAHISVYKDTIYWGRTNSDDNATMEAMTVVGDSLTPLFSYDWNLPVADLYINSVVRLPNSDTTFSITRGYGDNNDQNFMYSISTNRGQSWGSRQYVANWSTIGRMRLVAFPYNNTVAIACDSADNSIVWFEWNRATKAWVNKGRAFNKSFWRGYSANSYKDTVRFVSTTYESYNGTDSVYWAYMNAGSSTWTSGAFKTSINNGVHDAPYSGLVYIENSKRLVLFYTMTQYNVADSVDIYMKYWRPEIGDWSDSVKVSIGKKSNVFDIPQTIPSSHGDVAYVSYPMDSTIGGTTYHYAMVAKVAFQSSGDTIPPGKVNDLGATPGGAIGQLHLSWTAPGDDNYSGTANHYVIKYSTTPITVNNWISCPSVTSLPTPLLAGQVQSCTVSGLSLGQTYYFALRSYDEVGNISLLSNIAYLSLSLDIADNESKLPGQMGLKGNYPNPFNSSTTIYYYVSMLAHVTLSVYDILGEKINTLVDENKRAGEYNAYWNGKDSQGHDVSSGVYFCHLKIDNYLSSKKMLLLK